MKKNLETPRWVQRQVFITVFILRAKFPIQFQVIYELKLPNYFPCPIIWCCTVESDLRFWLIAWTARDLDRGTKYAVMRHRKPQIMVKQWRDGLDRSKVNHVVVTNSKLL